MLKRKREGGKQYPQVSASCLLSSLWHLDLIVILNVREALGLSPYLHTLTSEDLNFSSSLRDKAAFFLLSAGPLTFLPALALIPNPHQLSL
jgi:hypothetical protein